MVQLTPELVQKAKSLRIQQQAQQAKVDRFAESINSPEKALIAAAAPVTGAFAKMAQAPTFGYADEIVGGIDAARKTVPYLIRQASGNRVFTNTESPGEAYRNTRDFVRGLTDSFDEANPKTALAMDVGGAVMSAPRALGSVGGRIVQGGLEGAAYAHGSSEGNQTEQVFDTAKGGILGAGMAGALEVISPRLGKLYTAVKNKLINTDDGLAELAQGLKEAGQSPDDIARVLESAKSGADDAIPNPNAIAQNLTPAQQQRADLLKEYDVRGSAGDITRDPMQQSLEDAYYMGRKGEKARAVFEEFNIGKQEDFASAVSNVRQTLGKGQDILEKGQGAERLAKSIVKKANEERQVYRDAYGQVTKGMKVAGSDMGDFVKQATDDLINVEAATRKTSPKAFAQLDSLKSIIKTPKAKIPEPQVSFDPVMGTKVTMPDTPVKTMVNYNQLERWRSRLGDEIRTFGINEAEKRDLVMLRDRFDGYMDSVIEKGLQSGDAAMLEQLKNARTLRAQYAQRWQAKNPEDAGKRFLENIVESSRRTESPFTGEQVVNEMLGASKLGFKPQAADAAKQIKKIFGQNSAEFTDLKLEMVNRLLSPLKESQVSSRTLRNDPAIQTYKTALNSFITENPTLAREVFSSQEMKYLKDLGEIGTIAFQKVRSKTNVSGSGYTAFDLFTGYIDKILPDRVRALAAPVLEPIEETLAQRAAEKAISPEMQQAIIKKINKQPSDVIAVGLRRRFEVPATRTAVDAVNKDSQDKAPQAQPSGLKISPALLEKARQLRQQQNNSSTPSATTTQAPDITSSINAAGEQSGVDPSLLTRIAKVESGLDPNAANPNSSASGLFQFTDGTWREMVKKYGKELGVAEGDKNDPQANALMAGLFTRDNQTRLQTALKRPPTGGETYMAHFLGAGGALKLIRNRKKDLIAAKLFREAAKANKSIFYDGKRARSTAEVYNILSNKVMEI